MAPNLKDYNEVADRVAGFNEEYPNGRITTRYELLNVGSHPFITVRAEVWKVTDPDDAKYVRPDATGTSWLEVPGKTNFTRGSEIENAETSAVGRALAFIGFYAKGESLASKQEISSKKGNAGKSGGAAAKSGNSSTPASTQNDETGDQSAPAVVGQDKDGISDKQRAAFFAKLKEAGVSGDQRKALVFLATQKRSVKALTKDDFTLLMDILDAPRDKNPEIWENVELVSAE